MGKLVISFLVPPMSFIYEFVSLTNVSLFQTINLVAICTPVD